MVTLVVACLYSFVELEYIFRTIEAFDTTTKAFKHVETIKESKDIFNNSH